MEISPAVGSTDVLARQDVGEFVSRLDATIDRGFRRLRRALSLVIIGGTLANITATVVVTLLR